MATQNGRKKNKICTLHIFKVFFPDSDIKSPHESIALGGVAQIRQKTEKSIFEKTTHQKNPSFDPEEIF